MVNISLTLNSIGQILGGRNIERMGVNQSGCLSLVLGLVALTAVLSFGNAIALCSTSGTTRAGKCLPCALDVYGPSFSGKLEYTAKFTGDGTDFSVFLLTWADYQSGKRSDPYDVCGLPKLGNSSSSTTITDTCKIDIQIPANRCAPPQLHTNSKLL